MKKKLAVIFCALVFCFAFTACGGPDMSDSPYLGTWAGTVVEYSGMTLDVENTVGGWTIELLDDGTYKMVADGEETTGDWAEAEGGFTVDDKGTEYQLSVDGDKAVMEYEGMKVTFER